jgi:hypothetical protein
MLWGCTACVSSTQRMVHLTAAVVSTAGVGAASFPNNFTANQALLTSAVEEFEVTTGLLSVEYRPVSPALVGARAPLDPQPFPPASLRGVSLPARVMPNHPCTFFCVCMCVCC